MGSHFGPVLPALEAIAPAETARAASASARAFGVKFGLRVNDAAVLPALLGRLPPGAHVSQKPSADALQYLVTKHTGSADNASGDAWQIYAGAQLEAETADADEALEAFEGLVRFGVALNAPRWTFVHAGAVGWKGRAILIPGTSQSGKSHLVEAMVRLGATYYSDEFAVLDRRGRLFPYTQPLALRRASGGIDRVTAEQLGGTRATGPLPVGLIVSTHFVAGATWSPEPISAGAAVLALLQHTVRAQIDSARVLAVLAATVANALALDSPRGEAGATAAALLHHADDTIQP